MFEDSDEESHPVPAASPPPREEAPLPPAREDAPPSVEEEEEGWVKVSAPLLRPERIREVVKIPEFTHEPMTGGTPLPHTYILYYHPLEETKWTVDSFKSVRFRTVEEMVAFWAAMNKSIFSSYYVFMRAGFTPVWEDAKLSRGGSWSFKVTSTEVDTVVFSLAVRLVCGMLGDTKKIVGISSNAQKTNGIIKIWSTDFAYVTGDVGAEMLDIVFNNKISGLPKETKDVHTFCHIDQKYRHVDGTLVELPGSVRLQGRGGGWGGAAGGGGRHY